MCIRVYTCTLGTTRLYSFRPREHQHERKIDRARYRGSWYYLCDVHGTLLRGGRGRPRVQEDRQRGKFPFFHFQSVELILSRVVTDRGVLITNNSVLIIFMEHVLSNYFNTRKLVGLKLVEFFEEVNKWSFITGDRI